MRHRDPAAAGAESPRVKNGLGFVWHDHSINQQVRGATDHVTAGARRLCSPVIRDPAAASSDDGLLRLHHRLILFPS